MSKFQALNCFAVVDPNVVVTPCGEWLKLGTIEMAMDYWGTDFAAKNYKAPTPKYGFAAFKSPTK